MACVGSLACSFHALRHTYASVLIAAGKDVVMISWRLEHKNRQSPSTSYSHLFKRDDSEAADAMQAVFRHCATAPGEEK
jgi:integrase